MQTKTTRSKLTFSYLSNWEILALERGIETLLKTGNINRGQALQLLDKIEKCSHIKVI